MKNSENLNPEAHSSSDSGPADAAEHHAELPELNESQDLEDPRRPLQRALRGGVIALVAVTVFSLALWGGVRDLPGIWGALIGAAIGGGFLLLTVISALGTSNTSPATTLGVVLGSWILKAAVLLGVMFWLKSMDFYDATALAVTVILVLVVVLATETIAILRTNQLYVHPAG